MTLDKIVESCRYLLDNYPGAESCKSYLDSRLSEEAQEIFGFGYFPGIRSLSLLTDFVGEEDLRKEGLLFSREIEDALSRRKIPSCYFENHPLVLPYRNPYGQVVGLVGRTVLSEKERTDKEISKYKNTKKLLYLRRATFSSVCTRISNIY